MIMTMSIIKKSSDRENESDNTYKEFIEMNIILTTKQKYQQ